MKVLQIIDRKIGDVVREVNIDGKTDAEVETIAQDLEAEHDPETQRLVTAEVDELDEIPEPPMHEELDPKLRAVAQAALLLGTPDMTEIATMDLTPLPSGQYAFRAVIVRTIGNGDALRILVPYPLNPREEAVRTTWTAAIVEEYRRQWAMIPASSSIGLQLPTHPDEVDRWYAEAHA